MAEDDLPLSLEEEEVAYNYRKLLKFAVPKDAVRNKMKREGISERIVDALLGSEDRANQEEEPTKLKVLDMPPDECRTHFKDWNMAVDPRNPTLAWAYLKDNLPPVNVVDVSQSDAAVHTGDRPCPVGYSRWVCISDTHGLQGGMTNPIPDGDVLVHAGDFTGTGGLRQLEKFCNWMKGLPHRHKIVIAGNHELSLEETSGNSNAARNLINSCTAFTYLEDSSVEVLGYNVYGSPWQPEFCNWAFNLPRGRECAEKWQKIPEKSDIVITHGPPVGNGDLCSNGLRAGCVDLLAEVIQRVKPSHHIFGHIHEGYGCTKMDETLFLNASTCTFRYRPQNPPLVFDLPPRYK